MGNIVGGTVITSTLLLIVQGATWARQFLIFGCTSIMGMIFPFRYEPFVHNLVSQGNDEILK